MIKIFLTCRNRLEITKKCIQALYKHTHYEFQLYLYENLTDYKIKEHFGYLCALYKEGLIHQIIFNTKESTFNAFSKAVSWNQFGYNHKIDPNQNSIDFITLMDNDIIVTPDWDKYVKQTWKYVEKNNMKDVKIVGQLPGGIKNRQNIQEKICGIEAKVGKLGGSGFWCVKPNFFKEVGFLDLSKLVGYNKRHDQEYWKLLDKSTKGKPYILGLKHKLCIHCGAICGSTCNQLTKHKDTSFIKFDKQEKLLSEMNFDDFWKYIKEEKKLEKDW